LRSSDHILSTLPGAVPQRNKSTKNELVEALERRIKFGGPLTVAAYMTEILTHPSSGYYMAKDVLGPEGDFITSPEISQMFGELIGLWLTSEWINAGAPGSVQLLELGPGRGTLVDDICRVFAQIPEMTSDVKVALVELSQRQRQMQRKKLQTGNHELTEEEQLSTVTDGSSCSTRHGYSVSWYDDINSVPSSTFSFVIAHEFFDALPVHKFQKTKENEWREVCIDMDYSEDGPHHLRFALNPTPSVTATYLNDAIVDAEDARCDVEVSPASGALVQKVAQLVAKGGVALIADYGHEGSKTDTLRGFKGHKLWDPLEEPGSADITADVDFAFLRRMAENTDSTVSTCGPVTQRQFLKEMSIDVRLSMLLRRADREQQKNLISGYRMLTDPDQMGDKFKFFVIRQSSANGTPVGFLNMPVDCA